LTAPGGEHGTGAIGQLMGIVSGYVISHGNENIYLAGDTIWCREVQEALDKYQPDVIVLNGGGARFQAGDAIVMTIPDVLNVCNYAPEAQVLVVHLETVNHSSETRAQVKAALASNGLSGRCIVPDDGELISLY